MLATASSSGRAACRGADVAPRRMGRGGSIGAGRAVPGMAAIYRRDGRPVRVPVLARLGPPDPATTAAVSSRADATRGQPVLAEFDTRLFGTVALLLRQLPGDADGLVAPPAAVGSRCAMPGHADLARGRTRRRRHRVDVPALDPGATATFAPRQDGRRETPPRVPHCPGRPMAAMPLWPLNSARVADAPADAAAWLLVPVARIAMSESLTGRSACCSGSR